MAPFLLEAIWRRIFLVSDGRVIFRKDEATMSEEKDLRVEVKSLWMLQVLHEAAIMSP
jgi:hypothetical protein